MRLAPFDPISFLGSGQNIARWGDGEWHCILSSKGINADKCSFRIGRSPLLNALQQVDDVSVAMQPYAWRTMKKLIEPAISRYAPHRASWWNADFMIDLVREARIAEFTKRLKDFEVMMVGPARHASLNLHQHFIETPQRDACIGLRELESAIRRTKADVVLLSVGFAATVLAHWLHDMPATVMDVGSVWDPFCGTKNRGLWRKLVSEKRLPPLR